MYIYLFTEHENIAKQCNSDRKGRPLYYSYTLCVHLTLNTHNSESFSVCMLS